MPDSLPRPIVLLVEDSEDDVFFFRHVLKKTAAQCRVFHAGDGAKAVNYLTSALASPDNAENPWPDLVFLDLKLPNFSGFEILEWLRTQKLPGPLEVAILSGSDHATDTARAKALGVSAYFVKPITTDQLRSQIQVWTKSRATTATAV